MNPTPRELVESRLMAAGLPSWGVTTLDAAIGICGPRARFTHFGVSGAHISPQRGVVGGAVEFRPWSGEEITQYWRSQRRAARLWRRLRGRPPLLDRSFVIIDNIFEWVDEEAPV